MRPNSYRSLIMALVCSKRILVLGPSGAGKTYLTLKLSELLSRNIIHLDAHFWKPGWISTPQPEWRETVATLVQQENWIMDGTYESTLDIRIPAADAVILIDDRSFARLYRILRRRFNGDDRIRADAPPGQRIDVDYLKYIFRFSRTAGATITDQLSRCRAEKVLVTLSGRREVDRFIDHVERFVSELDGEN